MMIETVSQGGLKKREKKSNFESFFVVSIAAAAASATCRMGGRVVRIVNELSEEMNVAR